MHPTAADPPIKNQNSKLKNPAAPAPETGIPKLETPPPHDSGLWTQHFLLAPASLTLLLGEPGTGKSLLAIDLAARLSNNSPPPPLPHITRPALPLDQIPDYADPRDFQPASSIILSLEDSKATLVSRLTAAGADRDHLALSTSSLSLIPDEKRPATQPREPSGLSPLLRWLSAQLERLPNTRLLILDPLPAFLPNADSSASRIRTLLRPLLLVAEYHGFAILGISHLNKDKHPRHILHRSLGSQAFPALARAVYLLTKNPQTPSSATPRANALPQSPAFATPRATMISHLGQPSPNPELPPIKNQNSKIENPPTHLLIPLKNNLAPRTHALAFSITPTATLAWHQTPITDHPLLDPTSAHQAQGSQSLGLSQNDSALQTFPASQLEFAIEFLEKTLESGPTPSIPLLKQARALGISTRTLNRAKHHLNIHCHKDPNANHWLTYLPTHHPAIPDFSI